MAELRNSSRLLELLSQAVDDEDPKDLINPAWVARRWYDEDTPVNPPGALVLVSFVTSSSFRDNAIEEKMYTVQVEVDFSSGVGRSLRQGWIDEVLDEVDAVLTRHAGTWRADGKTGLTEEPIWDDNKNRFTSIERYDIVRRD